MNDRRRGAVGRDRGASLIVAIGFVMMIGTIAAGLSSLVTSSMNNRASLVTVRNRQYAADAAIEAAIAQVREEVDGPVSCADASGATSTTTNQIAVRVQWTSACTAVRTADGTAVTQRNVIFTSCVDGNAPCAETDVIIRAQVNFERTATGAVSRTYVQSWSVNR